MSKNIVNPKRQCPGDGYEISISICKGRQRVHYPKCPVCHYRTEAVDASSTSVEEDTEKANLETGNTRKVVQLSPNQDKAIKDRKSVV